MMQIWRTSFRSKVLKVSLFALTLVLGQAAAFDFYGEYRVLFDGQEFYGPDGDDADFNVWIARLSGDGRRIAFYGTGNDERLYIVDFDGSNLVQVPLPLDPDPARERMRVDDIAINHDGSRFFFITPPYQGMLYRVDIAENPIAVEVTEVADLEALHHKQIYSTYIKTTALGDWVYYADREYQIGTADLFRLSYMGGIPQQVIDDISVPVGDDFTGWQVRDFDISDDGANILFSLRGYHDSSGGYHDNWWGWVSYTSTGFHQLTSTAGRGASPGLISGDGSTIVMSDYSDEYSYISVRSDGRNRVLFESKGYNFAGAELNRDGSQFFYADHLVDSGRVANTDGTGGNQVLPDSDVNSIAVKVHHNAQFSRGGERVVFVMSLPTGPWTSAPLRLYAGTFNAPRLASPAPRIPGILFDSPYITTGEGIDVIMTTEPLPGDSDIQAVSLDSLRDGRFFGSSPWDEFSYGFLHHPTDDGLYPDVAASDGIYSAITAQNPDYAGAEVEKITVRVGVEDTQGNVAVADRTLWNALPWCSGDDVLLNNDVLFEDGSRSICVAGHSMQVGGIGVEVLGGAWLTLVSPRTLLSSAFSARRGSRLRILPL